MLRNKTNEGGVMRNGKETVLHPSLLMCDSPSHDTSRGCECEIHFNLIFSFFPSCGCEIHFNLIFSFLQVKPSMEAVGRSGGLGVKHEN